MRGAVQGGAEQDGIGFHVCSSGCIGITALGLSEQHLQSLFYRHTSETARYSKSKLGLEFLTCSAIHLSLWGEVGLLPAPCSSCR